MTVRRSRGGNYEGSFVRRKLLAGVRQDYAAVGALMFLPADYSRHAMLRRQGSHEPASGGITVGKEEAAMLSLFHVTFVWVALFASPV